MTAHGFLMDIRKAFRGSRRMERLIFTTKE